MSDKKLLPKKLQNGDTIGIIAPSGVVNYVEKFEKAKSYFEGKGFKVKIFNNAYKRHNYLAGTDEERLSDFMDAFEDKDVNAIITARGGSGANRILDKIDYEVIKSNPKIFVGFSDITAFHCALYKKAGLISFHGPFALFDFGADEVDEFTEKNFFKTVMNTNLTTPIENCFEYKCVHEGIAEGELVGGNLTVLLSIMGTDYFPDMNGKILYLEDLNEPVYKIDRMLSQLRLAGVFDKVRAVLVGKFSSDENNFEEKMIPLLEEINLPVGYGFSASHELHKSTLPLNVRCLFDAKTGALKLKESFCR